MADKRYTLLLELKADPSGALKEIAKVSAAAKATRTLGLSDGHSSTMSAVKATLASSAVTGLSAAAGVRTALPSKAALQAKGAQSYTNAPESAARAVKEQLAKAGDSVLETTKQLHKAFANPPAMPDSYAEKLTGLSQHAAQNIADVFTKTFRSRNPLKAMFERPFTTDDIFGLAADQPLEFRDVVNETISKEDRPRVFGGQKAVDTWEARVRKYEQRAHIQGLASKYGADNLSNYFNVAASSKQDTPDITITPKVDDKQVTELKQNIDSLDDNAINLNVNGSDAVAAADQTKQAIDDKGDSIAPWKVRIAYLGAKADSFEASLGTLGDKAANIFSAGWRGLNKDIPGSAKVVTWVTKAATFGFKAITMAAKGAWKVIGMGWGVIKGVASGLSWLAGRGIAAFKTLAVAAGVAGAAAYAAFKALRPAAEMQQFAMQVETLLGNAEKAKGRMQELSRFAKETNYSPQQIFEAGNLMEAFGFYSKHNLTLAADAANAFGKEITEIVTSLNYLYTGRGGEAFESLARIGVTREKLEPFGVKFTKSKELITEPKKAFDAVLAYFAQQFGGMTAKQGRTWKGAVQQMGGEFYDALAGGLASALGPLTRFVKGSAIPLISSIGDALKVIDWAAILDKPLKLVTGIAEVMRQAFDPTTRSAGIANIKTLFSNAWDGLKDVIAMLPKLGTAFLKDLGATFETFVGAGGIGKVFALAWDGLRLVMEGSVGLFKAVLSGFSREFLSGLMMTLDNIPTIDTGETKRRKEARDLAVNAVLEKAKSDNLAEYTRRAMSVADNATGGYNPGKERYTLSQSYMGDDQYFDLFKATERKALGWDEPTADPFAGFKTQQRAFASSLKNLKVPITTDNTKGALTDLRQAAAKAVDLPAWQLSRLAGLSKTRDAYDAQEANRQAYRDRLASDPYMGKLYKQGWTKEGKERTSMDWYKNTKAEESRFLYWQRRSELEGRIRKSDEESRRARTNRTKDLSLDLGSPLSSTEKRGSITDLLLLIGAGQNKQQMVINELQNMSRILQGVLGVANA